MILRLGILAINSKIQEQAVATDLTFGKILKF